MQALHHDNDDISVNTGVFFFFFLHQASCWDDATSILIGHSYNNLSLFLVLSYLLFMASNPWLIIIITQSSNLADEEESETDFAIPPPHPPSLPFRFTKNGRPLPNMAHTR